MNETVMMHNSDHLGKVQFTTVLKKQTNKKKGRCQENIDNKYESKKINMAILEEKHHGVFVSLDSGSSRRELKKNPLDSLPSTLKGV